MTLSRLRNLAPLSVLILTACTGVGYRYDYTVARQIQPWGQISASLHTTSSYYRDGVSMMNGPYKFVVIVTISPGSTVPATCKVRFGKAALLDAEGSVEAQIAPQDISRQTSPAPGADALGKQARMYISSQEDRLVASLPHDAFDLAYRDHRVEVDATLEGCGAADGDYRLRDVIRTDYQKRRFNPAFEALMSV